MLEPTSSVRSRGWGWGKDMSPPVKIVSPQQKKEICPGEGMPKRPPQGLIPKEVKCFLYVLLVGTDCGDTFQHIF